MEVLGYMAAILIGISLGMVGSGGSILTVPVLVYMMGMGPLMATTSSLFIVGGASLAGGIMALTKNHVNPRAVTLFGVPSVLSIFLTRRYFLPVIPETVISAGNFVVSREVFLMVLFAFLMIAASVTMITRKDAENVAPDSERNSAKRVLSLVLSGLGVGVVTGLLGAGGGFLIIPVLVLFLKLPMKTAVGSSLLIIAINTLSGFLFSIKQFEFDWKILISFTALSIAGIFVGGKLAGKLSPAALRKGFGWFVLVTGIYIIVKESFFT